MSFMKSLKGFASEIKDLVGDKDKDQQKQEFPNNQSTRGASDLYYAQQPEQLSGQYQPPHGQPSMYAQQPNSNHYGAPPSRPRLAPGWVQQWDPNSQRYYYLEQSTGRTQWEVPVNDQYRDYSSPMKADPYDPAQGYIQHSHGYPSATETAHIAGDMKHGGKKSNKGAMLAVGAGGLAVGGLAGAMIAGDDSSDEEHHHGANGAGGYGVPSTNHETGASYGNDAPATTVGDPEVLEHTSNISSSQRESLEEARHDCEEAQREAADSDASSSDKEEAEEAREEYQEEIEEAEEEVYDD